MIDVKYHIMSYTICPTAEEMKMIENMSKKDVVEFLKVTLLPFIKPRPEIHFTLCQKCVMPTETNTIPSADDELIQ